MHAGLHKEIDPGMAARLDRKIRASRPSPSPPASIAFFAYIADEAGHLEASSGQPAPAQARINPEFFRDALLISMVR